MTMETDSVGSDATAQPARGAGRRRSWVIPRGTGLSAFMMGRTAEHVRPDGRLTDPGLMTEAAIEEERRVVANLGK